MQLRTSYAVGLVYQTRFSTRGVIRSLSNGNPGEVASEAGPLKLCLPYLGKSGREPSYPADATAMAPGQRVRYHHVTLTPNEGDNGSSSSISIELPRANDAVCSIRTNVTGVTHLISSNKTLLPHTISLSFIEENCGS